MATTEVVRVFDYRRRSGAERRVLVDRLWPRGVKKEALVREPAGSVVVELRQASSQHRLVLLTATRDVERSGAEVHRGVLARTAR